MKKVIIIVLSIVLVLLIAATALWFIFGCNAKKPSRPGILGRDPSEVLDEAVANSENMTEMIEEYKLVDGVTYKLTFYDEFNGTDIDTTKWSRSPEDQRQNVGGYWDDSMITVENGNLVVSSAIREDGRPISGSIMSLGKFEQTKGYFEIKCKLHKASGFWGAFWLMNFGQFNVDGTAIDGAEIDIFESNHVAMRKINQNLHYDGYGAAHVQLPHSETADVYDGEYHTFAFLWTDNEYVWYIDGRETYRLSSTSSRYPGCCSVPTFMIISSEFGTWAGSYYPDELPDAWYVDYVKVYSSEY